MFVIICSHHQMCYWSIYASQQFWGALQTPFGLSSHIITVCVMSEVSKHGTWHCCKSSVWLIILYAVLCLIGHLILLLCLIGYLLILLIVCYISVTGWTVSDLLSLISLMVSVDVKHHVYLLTVSDHTISKIHFCTHMSCRKQIMRTEERKIHIQILSIL